MNGNVESTMNRGSLVTRTSRMCLLGAAALALATVLLADEAAPGARAARLSSVEGQVQVSKGSQVLAEAGLANTPLFEGTRVTTADDGRAEIQFEDGSIARLSPNSSLTLTTLRGNGSSGEVEIALEGGLGYFELQGATQSGTIRVSFGDSVVTPGGFTVMRIDNDNPPGDLAVFSGNAHLERGTTVAVDLHGGESVALSPNDIGAYTLKETIEPDSWDGWNSDRDQALSSEAAAATGATKGYGQGNNPAWSDLDANGNWYNVPGQGNVWSPDQASDASWDPYGSGSWMYSPGYGYTWISAYSWGYLPYQCGLWNWYDGFGWGWAPGVGGCNPWWSFGGIGYFGANIGRGYNGYRPPIRPHPRPPLRQLGGGIIAVNRRLPGPDVKLPARDKTSIARIDGYMVQAMRPVSPRVPYQATTVGYMNRTAVTNGGAIPATGQARTGTAPGARTAAPAGAAPRNQAPGRPAPSRSSPPAPSHASGGASFSGGGGGAAHASGGGGHH